MNTRFEFGAADPKALQVMMGLETYCRQSDLSPSLLELIKIRASQLNRCAFCIDMHTKDARYAGETEQRLYALTAWEETPFYTPEERAVLALTESVTELGRESIPNAIYQEASRYFNPKQVTQLLMVIIAINAWNRISLMSQIQPGSYQIPQVA